MQLHEKQTIYYPFPPYFCDCVKFDHLALQNIYIFAEISSECANITNSVPSKIKLCDYIDCFVSNLIMYSTSIIDMYNVFSF